ncbi:hypothetical protein DENSPDRAFT_32941 [Dentipellis sp. KUC8613]|nr:hypothetical protein DENSPDRAFT_32941 [Dentipellis sp. KUC8613]
MAPCSIALGAAFAAVQLVYQAYSKVKTNRARCARLVDRCQYVVDRIQRLVVAHGDEAVRARISELEATFASVARIITEVGTQGVLTSLLQSDANALQIEACTDALADLLTLFNLENTTDIGRWQREFEDARLRDHEELRGLGRRLESGNAAIARELAQQGVTIAEVHRLVQNISVGLPASDATGEDPAQTQIRTLASPISPATARDAPCTCEKPMRRSSTVRRPSWTSRVKLPPLANVLTKLSSPSRRRLSRGGPGLESPVDEADVATALDPPPPYRLHVANPEIDSEGNSAIAGADSDEAPSFRGSSFTVSNASSEAIRAPDSPVPTVSPCPPPQSTFDAPDDCFVKRSTTRRKRTTSVSTMSTSTPTLRRKDAVIFRRKTIAAGARTYQPVFYE